jgi:LDH2 family malate/lactate/ureidoglycolate dehydrogenase
VSTAFLAEGADALDSWRIGHLVVAMDVEAFLDRAEYLRRTDELIARCRRSRPATGADGVMLPGEPEWRCRAKRLRDGVPLPASTRRALDEAAAEWGLEPLASAS